MNAILTKITNSMSKAAKDFRHASKDKNLAMNMAEHGIEPMKEMLSGMDEEVLEGNRNTFDSAPVNPKDSRFFRLTAIDNYYKTEYTPPVYDNEITLPKLCESFKNFAASRLGLFYDIETIRRFVSGLGSCRLLILQGIPGTGKTSLPYGFGKFLQLDSTIAAVQPSWRERSDLFGYYNDFTKKYIETDFLTAIYEANYYEDPHIIVLDEMNIARVEYYFEEMLSVLEMPGPEEWIVDIAADEWDNDPCLISGGKIRVSPNTWFLGTINNDYSAFAVADKVYDLAIPIDLDKKAPAFEVPDTQPVRITAKHLQELYNNAIKDIKLDPELMSKLSAMDRYMLTHFSLSFGDRIIKQIKLFIPIYAACGGTQADALDFMVAKKVLRRLESLNPGEIRDEIGEYIRYLDKTFGKENFKLCKEYLQRIEKSS